MKKLALAAAMLLAGQFVNAQTQKGKQNFGLSGIYQHSTNSNGNLNSATAYPADQVSKSTFANIGPSYGYFIADDLELGGALSYTYNRQTNDYYSFPTTNFNEAKTNSFGVSAYFRKYVLYQNKIGFRTGPYAGYQWGKQDYNYIPGTSYGSKYTSYNVGGNFDLV
ncbi:hypothetical protein [Mucilaginibacter antarcticus]|uniref:hypothetical protein n=1 Tax=Mucilaginibacter antarcticus TaxID=1855725 RepID=UPI00363803DE